MRYLLLINFLIMPYSSGVPTRAQIADGITLGEELQVFSDAWMEEKMTKHHIPGSVLVVVKDGLPLFSKGYGTADLETIVPMDPDKTILRVASISKLVTATAVMQVFERGLVDLQTDIRTYIEPDLMRAYPSSVNLHQLLTHSAGVGDKFFGQTVKKAKDLLPLEAYLREELTKPLAPPGFFVNYSSHGISLAAHVVEKVTGLNFEEYCQQNIFGPLGMDKSTFVPSDALMKNACTCYKYIFGGYRILPMRHWRHYPASTLTTTGNEMGRFMITHLEKGTLQLPGEAGKRIFSTETTQIMHRRQFTMHPRMPGMAYGFWERRENGWRLLWHSGHMPGHRTGLFLMPSERLGLFLFSNTEFRLFDLFIEDFFDRFYPSPKSQPILAGAKEDLNRYAGAYRHTWYPRRTIGKITAFHGGPGQQLNVKPTNAGKMLLIGDKPYEPVVKNLFRLAGSDEYTAFWETTAGNPLVLYQGGMFAYHRLRWFQRVEFHYMLSALVSLIFLVSFSIWAFSIKKSGLRRQREEPWCVPTARLSAGLVCAFYLAFFVGLPAVVSTGAYKMVQEIQLSLKILLAAPLLGCASSAVLFCALSVAWNFPQMKKKDKILYTIILLNSLAAAWFLNHWNLLGYRF